MRWVPARSYEEPTRQMKPRTRCAKQTPTYLENHAGGDDGGDTQFHQSTPVTGQHHTQPVQRVRGVGGDNAVQRHLTHDQEDQQGQLEVFISSDIHICDLTEATYPRPHQLLVEGNLGFRSCHLREEGRERFDEIEESD